MRLEILNKKNELYIVLRLNEKVFSPYGFVINLRRDENRII